MKDNFSTGADKYAKYRPTYPNLFFHFLKGMHAGSQNAWDCATGTGQVAASLSAQFDHVFATDISQSQISQAPRLSNIVYSVQPAESTNFPDNFFDLITVAQAVHWFDFEKFFAEVKRTGRDNGLLVILGYTKIQVEEAIDQVIAEFYTQVVGPFWDGERKYVDENYLTIPFPFEEIKMPTFANQFLWDFDQLIGYLGTWSAVSHYKKAKGTNPINLIEGKLKKLWGPHEQLAVHFPLLLRVGRIKRGG